MKFITLPSEQEKEKYIQKSYSKIINYFNTTKEKDFNNFLKHQFESNYQSHLDNLDVSLCNALKGKNVRFYNFFKIYISLNSNLDIDVQTHKAISEAILYTYYSTISALNLISSPTFLFYHSEFSQKGLTQFQNFCNTLPILDKAYLMAVSNLEVNSNLEGWYEYLKQVSTQVKKQSNKSNENDSSQIDLSKEFFDTYDPTNLNITGSLVRFYATKSESTYYILPLLELSIFNFKECFVNSYIDYESAFVYVKLNKLVSSISMHEHLVNTLIATDEKGKEYYFLQFEIPDKYHKYYNYFKENKLNKFDSIAPKILHKAGLLYDTATEKDQFNLYISPKEYFQTTNKHLERIVYSLYNPLSMIKDTLIKTKLYDERLKVVLDNDIMSEEDFFSKVAKGEIDLSEKIDSEKNDIQLEFENFVSIKTV
jgi:hypothetical protein